METIDKIPTSCADLRRIGHIKSGLFLVMGNEMVETVYCNFTKPDESGTYVIYRNIKLRFDDKEKKWLGILNYLIVAINRVSKMDWLRRRQIGALLFLRSEKLWLRSDRDSHSI